ncbi:MAG: hypothetical protein NXI24_15350 [bacterium]|nr:hypothetical protein [bacterium]
MARSVRWMLFVSLSVAFLIGAVSAAGSVYAEYQFPETACSASLFEPLCLRKYAVVAVVTVLLAVVELLVLAFISIWTVFQLARMTGQERGSADLAGSQDVPVDASGRGAGDAIAARVPNLLSRAALEIPDPVREVLGIDPMRNVPKRTMLLVGILYKLKITASNVIAKLILRRILGKSAVRVGAAYIAVPITGLWNAIVTFRVAREARLRLFGNILAGHIIESELQPEALARLSPRARLGCLQAVGNAIVFAGSNHPNLVILLARLYEAVRNDEIADAGGTGDAGERRQTPESDLADWNEFLATLAAVSEKERRFLLRLLAIAAAFDGRISRQERKHLGAAFGQDTEAYFLRIRALQRALLNGRLYQAKAACRLRI